VGVESLREAFLCLKAVNELFIIGRWAKLLAPLEESNLVEDFALF
jgi:hypothetical protein